MEKLSLQTQFLADPGEARGCSTNSFVIKYVIKYVIKSWFVKIYLRRRHAQMVEDGGFSHKIDYLKFFFEDSKYLRASK